MKSFEWPTLAIFSFIAILFASDPIFIAFFLRPQKGNPDKEATYECGLVPKGSPWVQFNVQYYLYGLVFLIFDIEILYVYPWAVNFIYFDQTMGIVVLIEMFVFLFILVMGLFYAWKKGALNWE